MEKQLLTFGIIVLLAGIVIQSGYFVQGPDDDIPPGVFDSFSHYVSDFNKVYASPEERSYRLHVFYANFLYIYDLGDDESVEYSCAYTIFSDFTLEEYQQTYLMTTPRHFSNELFPSVELDTSVLADTVDWRKTPGVVSGVFFQKACASQWGIGIVSAVESFYAQKGTVVGLSLQQILDCASDGFWNHGCKGGSHADAAKWILENGLTTGKDYPYEALQNPKCKIVGGKYKPSFQSVKKDTTGAQLKAAVKIRPVSVCFNASLLALYVDGPVNKNTEGPVNSCGLLVGYDADGWIIQQSFSLGWGDEGYLHLSFSNVDSGIYDSAFYAV